MTNSAEGVPVSVVTIGVPVKDIDVAKEWYKRWLRRDPDMEPMPGMAEWKISSDAYIQLLVDEKRAGSAIIRLGVDDAVQQRSILEKYGVEVGELQEYPGIVRMAEFTDPDGNQLSVVSEWTD